jgi:hypothetical protein
MMTRLGTLLTNRDLPAAELGCAVLDGEVVAVGDGWCPLDAPVGASERAQAAALLVPGKAIAERMTAAWILGATPEPIRHHFSVDTDLRAHLAPSPRIQFREVTLEPGDTELIGGLRITTPVRTMVDLARHGGVREPNLLQVIANLATVGGAEMVDAFARLDRHPHAPHTRRARLRLHRAALTGEERLHSL